MNLYLTDEITCRRKTVIFRHITVLVVCWWRWWRRRRWKNCSATLGGPALIQSRRQTRRMNVPNPHGEFCPI